MTSDLLIRISKACPNVVGTKFTCGDTGKLARVARAMDTIRPVHAGSGYWAVAGLADFTLQGLVVGSSGVIAGGANITPKATINVFKLFSEDRVNDASQVQGLLAAGDWVHTAGRISATKAALQESFGYGGVPRLPLTGISKDALTAITSAMEELIQLEKSL